MLTNFILSAASDTLNFWESFVELFAGMTPIVAIFFVLGILLCLVEVFLPGIGWFGGLGGALYVAAMIIRMVQDGNLYMLLWMIIFGIIIIGGIFVLVAHSIRKGKLSKIPMFDVGSSVPEGITEGTKDYSSLLGKIGVTTTFLRPIGLAEIDNNVYDVVAKTGVIDADTKVKVVLVEGQRIVVEQLKD